MTPSERYERTLPRFSELADALKKQGLLGQEESCPLAEITYHAPSVNDPGGIDLVARKGADPARLKVAEDLVSKWDWNRKAPRVTTLAQR